MDPLKLEEWLNDHNINQQTEDHNKKILIGRKRVRCILCNQKRIDLGIIYQKIDDKWIKFCRNCKETYV